MKEELKRELDALAIRHGGKLDTDILYEAARVRGTALYEYCDQHDVWDKDKAARHHADSVLGDLYRKWKVETVNTRHEVIWKPVIVRDPDKGHDEKGMRTVESLEDETDKLKMVICNYIKPAIGYLKSAQGLAEKLECMEYFDEPIEVLNELLEKFKGDDGRPPKGTEA